MTIRIAILDEDNSVKLVVAASTLEDAMANVPDGVTHIMDAPPEVEGGNKYTYNETTETFLPPEAVEDTEWAARIKSAWDQKLAGN